MKEARDKTPVSRLAKYHGAWLVVQANIEASDMRDDFKLGTAEEASVYVPNATAAAAPELLAALRDALPELEAFARGLGFDSSRGMRTFAVVERVRSLLQRVEQGEGQ